MGPSTGQLVGLGVSIAAVSVMAYCMWPWICLAAIVDTR